MFHGDGFSWSVTTHKIVKNGMLMVYYFIPMPLEEEPNLTFVHNEFQVNLTCNKVVTLSRETLNLNVHPLCNSTIIHQRLLQYLCVLVYILYFQ